MSHPFHGQVFTFSQPDGHKLQVRGWGDQYSARFETLDGYTVVRNPATGFYELAQQAGDGNRLEISGQSPTGARLATIRPGLRNSGPTARAQFATSPLYGKTRWQQRLEQSRAAIRTAAGGPALAPPARHTIGTFVGLCLPVSFSDVSTPITPAQISDFCNKSSYNGFGNNGSVRDYFRANSSNKCDYSTIIAPLYTTNNPRSHYTDPTQPYGKRAQELVHEALAHHKSIGFDFSPLTADSSSFVYATNVFYAGDVINNWSQGLWPHAHFLANQVNLAPGKIAHDYQITALGNELQLGTYCHENGHLLCDFPDLYDYDSDSAGIGEFCLMCAGNHADQKNPVQIGAYLKHKAGWAGSVAELTSGLNTFFIRRKNSREYYIIENRHRSGRDAALPDSGLAIWHVDELGNNRYQQDDAVDHYECALIQADGRLDLEANINQGDVGDLHKTAQTFSGKWWDQQLIGITIKNISAPGQTVTFKVE
jgi:M6 family metalloprotease-like protein